MDIFYDLYQNAAIHQAGMTAERSERKAENAEARAERLEARINKLTLINMALWSLLKEKTGLSDEDLNTRIQEIDLADGYLDGRIRAVAVKCPHCNQTLSKKHNRCLYCGFEPQDGNAFETVTR